MADKQYKLAISIINYRTGDLTLGCIQSVLADLDGIDGRIVMVDNASGDGSAEHIKDWLAGQDPDLPVDIVMSPTNSGFSGGHNQGIAAVNAEFYLLLNSDAVLKPGFCRALLAATETDRTAGLYAPRIDYDDGGTQTSCFRFHSPSSELLRAARSAWVTALLPHREVALGSDPDPSDIEWASFACILLRGTMVKALGPMDEGYFLYYEDAEYCLRARRAGWALTYVPQAVAIHFRGGSGPVKSLVAERKPLPDYYYASRARFLYQAHGRTGLITANILWYVGRGLANLKWLGGKRVRPLPEGEGRGIWTNVFSPLGPRFAPHERPSP